MSQFRYEHLAELTPQPHEYRENEPDIAAKSPVEIGELAVETLNTIYTETRESRPASRWEFAFICRALLGL